MGADRGGVIDAASVLYEVCSTNLSTAASHLSSLSSLLTKSDLIRAVDGAYDELARSLARVRKFDGSAEGFEDLLREFCVQAKGVLGMFESDVEKSLGMVLRQGCESDLLDRKQKRMKLRSDESGKLVDTCTKLVAMGFVEAVGRAVYGVVWGAGGEVISHLMEQGGSCVEQLEKWVNSVVVPWMNHLLAGAGNGVEKDEKLIKLTEENNTGEKVREWSKKVKFHFLERLSAARAERSLEMVKRWPKSRPEWEDLRVCWSKTDEKRVFASALVDQLDQEVLHPGTMTADVIQIYISLIRVSRFVDPSGIFLEWTSYHMRDCLRSRTDTVRCIVTAMMDDGDLYEELSQPVPGKGSARASASRSLILNEELSDEDDFDIDDKLIDWDAYDEWEPEPTDAPVGDRWRTSKDTLGLFASIYGSGEAIVNQYRASLARKLLANLEYDYGREESVLELVKTRFGEEAVHYCTIMLKDSFESQAVLKLIMESHATSALSEEDRELFSHFETLVISRYFWPKLPEGDAQFRLAPKLERMKSHFELSYNGAKEPRTLKWYQGLGRIMLNLTFGDGRKITVEASPLQSSILMYFEEKSKWHLQELCEVLRCDERIVRRNLNPFLNQGVICEVEEGQVYETVENASDVDALERSEVEEDERDEKEDASDDDSEKSELAVYESYIVGMLQNLKKMPVEKIHNMLKIFVKTPVYDKTQDQLAEFLEELVAKGKIEVASGQYMPVQKE